MDTVYYLKMLLLIKFLTVPIKPLMSLLLFYNGSVSFFGFNNTFFAIKSGSNTLINFDIFIRFELFFNAKTKKSSRTKLVVNFWKRFLKSTRTNILDKNYRDSSEKFNDDFELVHNRDLQGHGSLENFKQKGYEVKGQT